MSQQPMSADNVAVPGGYLAGAFAIAIGIVGLLIGIGVTTFITSGEITQATVIEDCPRSLVGCNARWTLDGVTSTGNIKDVKHARAGEVFEVRVSDGSARLKDIGPVPPGIIVVSALLVVAGFALTKRATAKARYRITRPFSSGPHIVLWAGVAAVLGLAWLVAATLHIAVGGLLLILLPAVVKLFVMLRTAFVVDEHGLNIGGAYLPWNLVAQIVISDRPDRKYLMLGIRPREGAQLPETVTGLEPAPDDPSTPVWVEVQRRKFRMDHLLAKLRQFGPADISLVTNEVGGERDSHDRGRPSTPG